MPNEERRRRGRSRALAAAAAASAAIALAAPAPASAADEWFCTTVWLESTQQCRADNVRSLWSVAASLPWWEPYRICVASATSKWGSVNSDWRCDYTSVRTVLGGSVTGVGVVRNGATFGYRTYTGVQSW